MRFNELSSVVLCVAFAVLFSSCTTVSNDSSSVSESVACRDVSWQVLRDEVLSTTQEQTIVFFASWCADCRHHLESIEETEDVIFVAFYDEPESAQKALNLVHPGKRCFAGEGIIEHFGVRDIPARRTWRMDGEIENAN